jgi:hypothetical protein
MKNQTSEEGFEAIFRKGGFRFTRPVLVPGLFWTALESAIKLLPGEPVDRLMSYLVPPRNPGSGVLRGRQNIAKSLTYRATYVPGGFNLARDSRRAMRRQEALGLL